LFATGAFIKKYILVIGRLVQKLKAESIIRVRWLGFMGFGFSIAGYKQSPIYHLRYFSESGLPPRHLNSRLQAAPTSLLLAVSI
jgi:hypothetical protein